GGDPGVVIGDETALVPAAEEDPVDVPLVAPVLRGPRVVVRAPDAVAVVGGEALQRGAGDDRGAVRVFQVETVFEDVVRADADDQPAEGRELAAVGGQRTLPAVVGPG